MSGTYSTLLLDTANWDLCVDAGGDIAVAQPPYALAQDAASAIRLFAGELYYDVSQGVPYFTDILGQFPSLQTLKTDFANAALTVPGVVEAVAYVTGIQNRQVMGQVQVTDQAGAISAAAF